MLSRIINKHSGFTLLFAVLVGGVVLALGLGIFNIVYRELQLSSLTRDSDIAFFAADAGMECGLYWEFQDRFIAGQTTPVDVRCAGQTQPVQGVLSGPVNNATTTWTFNISVGQILGTAQSCAIVSVAKNPNSVTTYVVSRGRNDGGAACLGGPRIVERTLEAYY